MYPVRAWLWISLVTVTLAAPGALSAQAVTLGPNCSEGWSTLGALGISEFSCDCTFDRGTTPAWRFRGEPEIRAISPGGPAAGRLRAGDVIVALDGLLITTRAAGARLAQLEPGEAVVLTVRRGNREIEVRITPDEPCTPPVPPTPPAAAATPSPVRAQGGTPPRAPRVSPPPIVAQPAIPVPPTPPTPAAWFGFGISCTNCELNVTNRRAIEVEEMKLRELLGRADDNSSEILAARARVLALRREGTSWKFSEYPSLFSVDPGSPADGVGLRRGDVLLRIDGISLLTAEGARRFSQVEPGQAVALTYRRGGAERTVRIQAIERPSTMAKLASAEGVTEALAVLERTQAQRAVELSRQAARLEETLASVTGTLSSDVNQRKLAELTSELDRLATTHSVESEAQLARLRQELELVAQARTTPLAVAGEQHLRFAGSVGNTEVEVRGLSSVEVSYDNSTGELLIRTMDSTIRVKAPAPRR